MDPFSKLPPEMRVHILINVKSGHDLLSLLHASPIMFKQYRTSKQMIRKGYLGPWLNKSLLHDVIAIVTCPESYTYAECENVQLHLRRWGSKDLPDPTENLSIFCAVGTYVRRLEMYMADYIAKATSTYLPFAYLTIPDYSTSYTPSTTQLRYPKHTSHVPARLENLTLMEWERLARGFLRHELLSQALRANEATRRPGHRFRREWTFLERFENIKTHPRETDMIECVQEYISTLWGALNREIEANTLDRCNPLTELPISECPDSTDPNAHQRGLFTPDSSRFTIFHRHSHRLGLRGLRFFDFMIQESNITQKPVVRCFLETEDWDLFWVRCMPPTDRTQLKGTEKTDSETWRSRRWILGESQRVNARNEHNTSEHGDWKDISADVRALFAIYQQRAWALFDNDRLYPHEFYFPVVEEIQMQYAQWPAWYGGMLREARLGYAGDVKYPLFGRLRTLLK